VTAKETLEAFGSWCALHSEKNIGQTLFKRLAELGYAKRKQGGTVRYVALRPTRAELRLASSSHLAGYIRAQFYGEPQPIIALRSLFGISL